jgi:large subunit ribosomal protein L24
MGPKHENEVPLPMDHLRLVTPSEIIEGGSKVYKDVVVEKIFMERHTTGIDPYTGTDYGDTEIPKEHQYDPRDGSPIFHRYIAGTRHRIEWPWEHEEVSEDKGKTEENNTDRQTGLRRLANTFKHPITSYKRWTNKKTEIVEEKEKSVAEKFRETEEERAKKARIATAKAKDSNAPEAYDGVDTTRNVVLDAESMAYTLVAPPFPDTLREELRSHIHEYSIQARKDARKDPDAPAFVKSKPNSEKVVSAMEKARLDMKMKKLAAGAMKTPMQLRWELEQRRKAEKKKTQPLVDDESLLVALGGHMATKGGKPYLGKKEFAERTQELD